MIRFKDQNKSSQHKQEQENKDFVVRGIKIPYFFDESPIVQRVFIKEGDTLYDGQVLLEMRQKFWFSNHKKVIDYHYFKDQFMIFSEETVEISKINVEEGKSYPYRQMAFEATFSKKGGLTKDGYTQSEFKRKRPNYIFLFTIYLVLFMAFQYKKY
ncbi:hypothetical protein ABPG72_022568 [Tetrahymena utriculariae]